MLRLNIGLSEYFDETERKFVKRGGTPVTLRHSLLTISKWEETWEKSFLSDDKTDEQMRDYIRCMIFPEVFDTDLVDRMTPTDFELINEYINAKKSATLLPTENNRDNQKKRITSEQVYGWMVALTIDWRAEEWHFNRLLTLIQVCNIQNSRDPKTKNKPVTGSAALANRRAQNQARRAQNNSSG